MLDSPYPGGDMAGSSMDGTGGGKGGWKAAPRWAKGAKGGCSTAAAGAVSTSRLYEKLMQIQTEQQAQKQSLELIKMGLAAGTKQMEKLNEQVSQLDEKMSQIQAAFEQRSLNGVN